MCKAYYVNPRRAMSPENFWAAPIIANSDKSANWPTVHSLPGIKVWPFPQILSVGNEIHFPFRLDNVVRLSTFLLYFPSWIYHSNQPSSRNFLVGLYWKTLKFCKYFLNISSSLSKSLNIKIWQLVLHAEGYSCRVSWKLKNIFSDFFQLMECQKSSLGRFYHANYPILKNTQNLQVFP